MIKRLRWGAMAGLAVLAAPLAAGAPPLAPVHDPPLAAAAPAIQSAAQAIAQDAGVYAQRYGVAPEDAVARLGALAASAATTDAIRAEFRARLVGISIDHVPQLRIVVLLTGSAPVAERQIVAAGVTLPILFRTGASASGDDVVRAMLQRGPELAKLLPKARGMGLDQRSGELVILLRSVDVARADLPALRSAAEAISGVKVRFDLADRPDNLSLNGGERVEGVDPTDGKRYACTAGFAVGDGKRTGIATAAHCPDTLAYREGQGPWIALPFVGQWGARAQDVQINLAPAGQTPTFYADRRSGSLRQLVSWRSRLSTRAGEWLCHYGESSGYSCAEVELTQFAPPELLCGGICAPSWITVRTHDCRSGDSGGPVFSGDVAFGITKGGSGGGRGTRCNFYFYMSTDFLPTGWWLLH